MAMSGSIPTDHFKSQFRQGLNTMRNSRMTSSPRVKSSSKDIAKGHISRLMEMILSCFLANSSPKTNCLHTKISRPISKKHWKNILGHYSTNIPRLLITNITNSSSELRIPSGEVARQTSIFHSISILSTSQRNSSDMSLFTKSAISNTKIMALVSEN